MNTALKTILTVTAVAMPSLAMAMTLDSDGDGMLTLDEVQAVAPDVTTEAFIEMDSNTDGLLDETEVAAAQAAGVLPASE